MARRPAVPNIEMTALPVRGAPEDVMGFAGSLLNYAAQQETLDANERAQEYYRSQDQYANQLQMIDSQRRLAQDSAEAASRGGSGERVSPVSIMKQQAEELRDRMNLFNMAAQLKGAQMEQDAREADYALAEPLAQLGSYAGTQNWGSFYAMRKSILSNPLYNKSRDVRSRMEALDQMLPQWGETYNARGEAKNFLDVTKEAESPDWATRKEALRILALKSENPSGFLYSIPGLTPMQVGELQTFIRSNPLVTDQNKAMQVRQFEDAFRQKLLEQTGNDHREFLRQLASPQTQRQLEDARRAILYDKGSDDVSYTNAADRMLDGDTLESLNEYINAQVDNSAGMLSLTRWGREAYTGIRKLVSKDYAQLSDDELLKVQSPAALERLDGEIGLTKSIGQSLVAGGAPTVGAFVDNVKKFMRLNSEVMGSVGTDLTSALRELEAISASMAKGSPLAAKTAAALSRSSTTVLTKLYGAAKMVGKSPGWVLQNTLVGSMLAPVLRKIGAGSAAKSAAGWIGGKAAAMGGAKAAGKIAGSAVGLGLDALFFYKDAGRDMGQVSDAFRVIKQAQAALQSSAAAGRPPPQMQKIMQNLMQAIDTVNTITQRHGVNVQLDLNNIVSRQIAQRIQGGNAVDEAIRQVYGTPQVQDPRAALRQMVVPQAPVASPVSAQQVSFDDIGAPVR